MDIVGIMPNMRIRYTQRVNSFDVRILYAQTPCTRQYNSCSNGHRNEYISVGFFVLGMIPRARIFSR
jgi:hypothetical protein